MISRYETLPVGKYEKLIEARAKYGENGGNALNLAILSILTGKPEDELLDMKLPEFRSLMDKAGFLRTAPIPGPVAKCYKVRGFDLIPVTDTRKMTAAQYIDFQTFAQDQNNRIAELLSCFLVPRGMRYNDGYDVLEVQTAIRENLAITQALGLLAFFLSKLRRSTISTLRSSIKAMKKTNPGMKAKAMEARMAAEMSMALLQGGDGWRMLTPFLK